MRFGADAQHSILRAKDTNGATSRTLGVNNAIMGAFAATLHEETQQIAGAQYC